MDFDTIILGAGLYGLYAALFRAEHAAAAAANVKKILVLEADNAPFKRATYINQARVHNGCHYPRSLSTALKSKHYFDRFNADYGGAVHTAFTQIYATSARFSWTSAAQFAAFCRAAGLPCDEIPVTAYFQKDACDGAFVTTEYTYDARILLRGLMDRLQKFPGVTLRCGARVKKISRDSGAFVLTVDSGGGGGVEKYRAPFVLNATYAAVNQINALAGFSPFKIKYELCEIILCRVSEKLRNVGLTVMDGPFFSLMPFGKTGLHSLTAVTFTPHAVSHGPLPAFPCQARSRGFCAPDRLGNCDDCPAKPATAWPYMSRLAARYLKDSGGIEYVSSLFSMKPILRASEIDDSRPTVIRRHSRAPDFVSVLSGKINTVYDLDGILEEQHGN